MLSKESPSKGPNSPNVLGFYDQPTGSAQYLVWDPATKDAALIDVVMEFDARSASTSFKAAQWALDQIRDRGLTLKWILDTHPHADHMMASDWLRRQTGAPNAIGEKVRDIVKLWEEIYNTTTMFDVDRDFDHLFADGDSFMLGQIPVQVMLHPGHTLGSISYVVGDAAFVHDTFMQPDAGTSRADFPGGSADQLYDSLQSILSLPDETRVFVGHDYGTKTRDEPQWESTVAAQRVSNTHVGGGTSRANYVKLRETRDATLPLPGQMLYALQVNLRGGRLPDPESDGNSYLKIPANRFTEPQH